MTWDFTVAHLQGVSPAEAVDLMGEHTPTGETTTVELANLDDNILVRQYGSTAVRQYGDWCVVVGSTPIPLEDEPAPGLSLETYFAEAQHQWGFNLSDGDDVIRIWMEVEGSRSPARASCYPSSATTASPRGVRIRTSCSG